MHCNLPPLSCAFFDLFLNQSVIAPRALFAKGEKIVANKYIVSALFAVGLMGNAHADNAVIGNPQLTATNVNASAHASMPGDAAKTSTLRSVNIEEDLKRTEQQLQVELTRTLAETVSEAVAAN
jgi:hypothetical protein